jgi:hypothetical protein
LTRYLASLTVALALIALGGAFLLGTPAQSSPAHALPLGPGTIGRSPTQVALTASYSIVGGGGSQAQDLLTYFSSGVQLVVPLTLSPAVYMVDSGTQWSAQTILNGSTRSERWITSQDVGGVIGAPLTVAFSYQHQYLVSFDFNVTRGGVGFSSPSVTFNQVGSGVSLPVPLAAWVDASSPYSFPSQLPGSSSSERWILQTQGSGTITKAVSVVVSYNHEYLVSSSYSIIGGGSPPPPTLSSTVLGTATAITMTNSAKATWLDAGAATSFSPTLSGTATERWIGTVVVQTQSGSALSTNNNGTVTSAVSITPVYYHQLLVNVSFSFVGGSLGALTPPPFTYKHFGDTTSLSESAAVWVDGGTAYSLPETVCCTASPSSERWELYNSTTGTISSSTKVSPRYFHQFMQSFSFSIVGQQPPSLSGQPGISYSAAGNTQKLTLLQSPQGVWADAASAYSAAATLPTSTTSERWFAENGTGEIAASAPASPVDIPYTQQYLITMTGGGTPAQWADAGSTTFDTPGFFGRSQGTGYRIVSYQVDSGAYVPISAPAAVISIPLAIDGPHTLRFQSVTQFQVALDAGAAGALASITPPTASGDGYWYDAESSVTVALHGAWGRAGGVGERITSISVTAQAPIQVKGLGTVQAFSTTAIQTPVSITTTSTTQYEVVLDRAAMAAFSSISPPSTFPDDTFWYDSGALPVTVVLDGVHSRSAGTGVRLSTWALDSGPVTKLATAGTFAVVTRAMTSPQFVNTTAVTQYQVTMDSGGTASLSSMTNPPIPSDAGWYDASSPVGVIMNGVWGRAAGTGQRLASFSINGGPAQVVASTGLVSVLNMTSLASPESITTSVLAQYQVVLDSAAGSALASITSTPVSQDKYWFDAGTPVSVSLDGVWGRSATTGTRLTSYSVNQGPQTAALSSGPVQALSLTGISGPESISAKTVAQYRLSSSPLTWESVTNPTIPGDAEGWFDTGTAVKAVYAGVWNQTSTGTRQSVASYTVDGGAKTSVPRSGAGNFTVTLTMTSAHSIAFTSVAQYALTLVGSPLGTVTATPPSPTSDSYFDSGSKETFALPRFWSATPNPGVREALTSYSLDGGVQVAVPVSTVPGVVTIPALTFTEPHELSLNGSPEYEVTFLVFDASGTNPLVPSGLLLGIGNSTVGVQGSSAWIENGASFKVIDVTWEGVGVGPTPPPSYHMEAAPVNVTLNARVYAASLRVVDLFGLPLSGAQVSMTLANGTIVTGTTKSDGTFSVAMVPLGAFTAKVSSLGSSAHLVGAPASAQTVEEGRVLFSLISLFAVVAVAAAGITSGVVILRLRKRAKASNVVS